jgi:hypothetical protein
LTRKTGQLVKANVSFEGIEQHFDAARVRTAADLARFVYAYAAYRNRSDLAVVKSDDMWERLDHIDTVIPNRRIILLTRDFRDNLLSITKKDFGPVEPLIAARFVRDRFARYEAEYERTPPSHRLHVRYEDLLAAPRRFVETFSRQFGLPLTPEGQSRVSRLAVRTGNVRKWQSLDRRTLLTCESVLQRGLLRYGYDVSGLAITPRRSEWALVGMRDAIGRVPQKVLKLAGRLAR